MENINSTKPRGRIPYWDNIKGFMVILMVFAHFLYRFGNNIPLRNLVNVIYTFHMPVFVFVSGFFGKSKRAQSFEGIIDLAFLFFVFNGVLGLVFGIYPVTTPKYSLWYLLVLVVWRLTAQYLARFKEILLILLCISVFVGFFPSINNTLAISRMICFYPYYMAGYLLSEEKSNELIKKSIGKRAVNTVLCLALSSVLIFTVLKLLKLNNDDLLMFPYTDPYATIGRVLLYVIGFAVIYAVRNITPNKKIPLVTMFGRNSLWIFLIHRPITVVASKYFTPLPVAGKVAVSAVLTVIVCAVLGNNSVAKLLNSYSKAGSELFSPKEHKSRTKLLAQLSALAIALGYAAVLVTDSFADYFEKRELYKDATDPTDPTQSVNTSILTPEQSAAFPDALRITFAGDMLLLEDQVKRGSRENGYDFSDIFQYTKEHISSADYAIGVFEGPMAGESAGYSSGNFDDGKELYLNYPDEFASAVKKAGFDLVTTANNHLLDKGQQGAHRTLDVLDKIGLDHTGSYRSAEEKEASHVKLVNVDGIKMAILSYTYGSNYHETYELANGRLSYLSSFIKDTEGELFNSLKAQVERDFAEAKALDPDLIIVLPHIGTQFSNTADDEQTVWFNIFKENGADIILGDHPHVVEPVSIDRYNGKNVFTLYCPGNFVNIYRKNQGDTSALVDVYIDRSTKQIIGGGIVPLYTMSSIDGNYAPIPISAIESDPDLRGRLSTDDYEKAKEAHSIVTKVMIGVEEDISAACESYLFNDQGYLRRKASGLSITENMHGTLYTALSGSSRACFIGDSLTEGTQNGKRPWYEPIEEHFPDTEFLNFSTGGWTIKNVLNDSDLIPTADLYVIAIGTNDVRYRDSDLCAMTTADFTRCAEDLRLRLLQKNSSAKIIFVAPWYSVDGDPFADMSFSEKTQLNSEYCSALEVYCAEKSIGFIDPNGYIQNAFTKSPDSLYLLDWIHPNASRGLVLYSEAVLASG